MTRLAIIVSTGSPETDRVLSGIMGHMSSEGSFTPISEFKNIPAVITLTPEVLASQPGSVVEVEIDDANLPAFKALMASTLQQRWEKMYAMHIERMPLGIPRAAVSSELDKVTAGCVACTSVFLTEAPKVSIVKPFENIAGIENEYDSFDEDGAYVTEFRVNASEALLASSGTWSAETPVAANVLAEMQDESTTRDMSQGAASGTARLQLSYHGDAQGLVAIFNQLPPEIASMIYGNEIAVAELVDITWHAPRPSQAETAAIARSNTFTPVLNEHSGGVAVITAVHADMDPIAAAFERGRISGRIEGYSSGYSAGVSETESDEDSPSSDAPSAG